MPITCIRGSRGGLALVFHVVEDDMRVGHEGGQALGALGHRIFGAAPLGRCGRRPCHAYPQRRQRNHPTPAASTRSMSVATV
jgi:hypothetical protein